MRRNEIFQKKHVEKHDRHGKHGESRRQQNFFFVEFYSSLSFIHVVQRFQPRQQRVHEDTDQRCFQGKQHEILHDSYAVDHVIYFVCVE